MSAPANKPATESKASGDTATASSNASASSSSSSGSAPSSAPHVHDTYFAHRCPRPPSTLPKIDLHTHILPENIPDLQKRYGYGAWVSLRHHADMPCCADMYKGERFFRKVEENCFRPEARIRDMDEQNVNVQVLSTVPVMFSYQAKPEDALDLHKFLNDHIAGVCRQYPTRFLGLGTIPMQSPEHAIPELQRCVRELGMVGVQIGSHINDMTLGNEKLFPIFEEAERLGACIFIHPWDMTGEQLMSKYWLPWLVGMPMETALAVCSLMFSGVFERLPNLRVCFAHGGGSFPGTIGRIEHGFYCRPDLVAIDCKRPPREWLGHFWLDSLVHDPVALQHITDLVGEERVVLGTDYPFPLGEIHIGSLIDSMDDEQVDTHQGKAKSPLSAEQRAQWSEERKLRMLWKNGLEFLGMEHQEERFLIDWSAKKKQQQSGSAQQSAPAKSNGASSEEAPSEALGKLAIAEAQTTSH